MKIKKAFKSVAGSIVSAFSSVSSRGLLGICLGVPMLIFIVGFALALLGTVVFASLGVPALVLMLAWNYCLAPIGNLPLVDFWQSLLAFWSICILVKVVR